MTKAAGKTYFLSDLHLGASYIDDPHSHQRRVVRFLQSIEGDAEAVYFLGDVLDYWFEYRTTVPRGYVRFFGQLARMADAGIEIVWFTGNHDIWLFDYLRDEIGLNVIDGSMTKRILGHTFYMAHGDGVGHLPWSFRLMRATFRNRFCQRLYSAIHPRWTIPFAHRWSAHSRNYSEEVPQFLGPEHESLIRFAGEYAATHPDIEYFVFGHRHVLTDYTLPSGSHVVILGDWIHHFSYARFDGESLSLHNFKG